MRKDDNEIVKYDNVINNIQLPFSSNGMSIFFSVISQVREGGLKEITLTFQELEKLSVYQRHTQEFVQDLELVRMMLDALVFKRNENDEYIKFDLFTKFEIKRQTQLLVVQVNPKFQYVVQDIKNWTRFSLHQFNQLKSVYAKTMFRILKRYRSTGVAYLPLDKFKMLLNISPKYSIRNINYYIWNKILVELAPVFNHLQVEVQRSPLRGKAITGYQVSFSPEIAKHDDLYLTGWEAVYRQEIINAQENLADKPALLKKSLQRLFKLIKQDDLLKAREKKSLLSLEVTFKQQGMIPMHDIVINEPQIPFFKIK